MDKADVLFHWRYFLSLEKDIVVLKDYIEICSENYNVHSVELSKILQLSCAEVDSVCRCLCSLINHTNSYSDDSNRSGAIQEYKEIIYDKYPNLTLCKIHVVGLNEDITPWKDWETKNSPDWWYLHNKVKHYRHSCFKDANLKNTLFSMSGLMVLILYLYRIVADSPYAVPLPAPQFFSSKYHGYNMISRGDKGLPDFEN